MKRITAIGVVIGIAGAFCIVAAYFSSYYYHLYVVAQTDLEQRCANYDYRIAYLEQRKHLIPTDGWGEISTTDRPASDSVILQEGLSGGLFTLHTGKGNWISPEFRIPAGSTNRQVFDIRVNSGEEVVGAWLSHAEPYQDLAAFDEFRAYHPHGTNVVRLEVQPKPGASFKFRFTLVVLHER